MPSTDRQRQKNVLRRHRRTANRKERAQSKFNFKRDCDLERLSVLVDVGKLVKQNEERSEKRAIAPDRDRCSDFYPIV